VLGLDVGYFVKGSDYICDLSTVERLLRLLCSIAYSRPNGLAVLESDSFRRVIYEYNGIINTNTDTVK
jgi:hypothetical protein